MSEADPKPPGAPGTVLGYSGFGAGGAGPKPPETPPPAAPSPFAPPAPAAAPPAPAVAPPAPAVPAAPPTAAPWPETQATPEPPATPPPAYGSAAPAPSPIGYSPYGAFGSGQPAGVPYASSPTEGGPGAPSPGPYGGPSPYTSPGPGAPFGGPPGTAMCAVHPETPAVGLCPRCGGYMCQWCQRINDFGEVFCATCMERVGYGQPIPWDRRQELGIFQAWWQTLKESLMKPDDFFARASHGLTTDPPLLFAMICGWLGQVGDSVIRLAMNNQPWTIPFLFVLGVPLSVVISVYVGGGIAHLFAKMFGGQGTYAATCRNWGFCTGPGALGLVPGLGALVAAFWTIVLEVYAVKHAHRLSGGKAAAAVLLPVGILVVLCCGLLFVIGAAMGSALGRGGSF